MNVVRRLLVVEDVPETAQWLSARAQAALGSDITVSIAHTLATARRLLKAQTSDAILDTSSAKPAAKASDRPFDMSFDRPFDMVIVDLGLPDGNGVELIQELEPARTGLTVIVATIYDDDAHIFSALRSGAQGYLLKDQSDEEIERALAGMEEGVPPISPTVARRMMEFFSQHDRHQPPTETDEGLSPREKDVLVLIASGMSVAEAAAALNISAHTVRGYVKEIYRKLGISSRAEASLRATRMGLIRL
ncbi:MAG: DNA-binding response regulator [Moraxellaceae bacterium]|nr:DNA-binding response regulator [Moraxellaceae bacterium]